MKSALPITSLLILSLFGACAPAQRTDDQAHQVDIENSRAIDIISSVNHHRYRITVSLPLVPPPVRGYRVLYLFDGNYYFGSATEAVRDNGNATDVVVVGVGYPDSAEFAAESDDRHAAPTPAQAALSAVDRAKLRERFYDLTLPASAAAIAKLPLPGQPVSRSSDIGGLDDLLKTIEIDVKPLVATLAPIDRGNQVLFGHSLGGLAVLRALFTEPGAYRTFVAASPSIWWADQEILSGEASFLHKVLNGQIKARLLITVGADEGLAPRTLAPDVDRFAMVRRLAATRMVQNARELADRLRAARAMPGYEVAKAIVFPHQAHGISVWPALGQAVSFAFQ